MGAVNSEPKREEICLAIDYGDQRIGLAVTDAEGVRALAHSAVPAGPSEEALAAIERVIAAEGAQRLIVGLPLTLEGREGVQARKTRAFGGVLAARTKLPVEFVDERFTTGEAERLARAKGTAPDAEAARLILEAWLERQKGKT